MHRASRKAVFFVLLIGVTYGAYTYMIKPVNKHFAEKKAIVQSDNINLVTLKEKGSEHILWAFFMFEKCIKTLN